MVLLIVVIVLALLFDYINGFHDAANSIATIVSTKVLTPFHAVLWAAFFNFVAFFIAKFIIGEFGIANTVAKTVLPQFITLPVIFSGLIAAITWNLLTWWLGIPSSSSHTLIGGFAGAAIASAGFGSIQGWVILKIAAFIFLAPLIGMFIAVILMYLTLYFWRNAKPNKAETWFRRLQLLSSALFSVGHGLNDSQKVMGIIAAALFAVGEITDIGDIPVWVPLACFSMIALGTMSGGWRIVKTVGTRITKVTALEGVVAETSGAITLFITEMLKIPVSTTHTITGAIIGVGAVKRLSAVRWGVTKDLLIAWTLTIPVSALMAMLVFFLFSCVQGATASGLEMTKGSNYYVAAYVWPSCHHDERFGDMLWPDKTGEWEVIKKGDPRFEGHYQPRLPLDGYGMDNDPKVVEKWIDMAVDHGVNIFVYDWYWFDGGPFLESALNDGFLKADNNSEMQFYIMWANHDVKRNYWNVHTFKDDTSLLWDGAVGWDDFKLIVERVIRQYFKQPNYFKIDGKPVFSIFSIENLTEGFGGSMEESRKALDYFREEVKKAGFPGLHIQWNQGGGSIMSEEAAAQFVGKVTDMGFNSVAMYNMGGMNENYLIYADNSIKIREQMDSILDAPLFPCVSIGWDDTPRFPAKGIHDVVHYYNTPENFAALLYKAKKYADSHPEQPPLITINAWNEWVEGSYLLPDTLNGFGYLEAVKKVIHSPLP